MTESPDNSKSLRERLGHTLATMTNDDTSEADTVERQRFIERTRTIIEACEAIDRLHDLAGSPDEAAGILAISPYHVSHIAHAAGCPESVIKAALEALENGTSS